MYMYICIYIYIYNQSVRKALCPRRVALDISQPWRPHQNQRREGESPNPLDKRHFGRATRTGKRQQAPGDSAIAQIKLGLTPDQWERPPENKEN